MGLYGAAGNRCRVSTKPQRKCGTAEDVKKQKLCNIIWILLRTEPAKGDTLVLLFRRTNLGKSPMRHSVTNGSHLTVAAHRVWRLLCMTYRKPEYCVHCNIYSQRSARHSSLTTIPSWRKFIARHKRFHFCQ